MPQASAALPGPTPNAGAQAQAALFASQGLELFKKALALVDVSSPLGQAIVDTLKKVGKQVGSAPPETQVNSLQSQLVEARRNAMQRVAMQQMQQQGGVPAGASPPGAAAGPATGAAPPQAAMAA